MFIKTAPNIYDLELDGERKKKSKSMIQQHHLKEN